MSMNSLYGCKKKFLSYTIEGVSYSLSRTIFILAHNLANI